jgi:hypothetical protein
MHKIKIYWAIFSSNNLLASQNLPAKFALFIVETADELNDEAATISLGN